MTLIPEDVLEQHLQEVARKLMAIPDTTEVEMTELYSTEGWASFTIWVRLPEQDPTGVWK